MVITISFETLDGLWIYCYTGYILGRTPRINEILPKFCENMDPDKWDTILGYPKSTGILRVDGCQQDPRVLERHTNIFLSYL